MFSSVARSGLVRQRAAFSAAQRRAFGSGPKPEWTGIDKTVRDVFPEDHQLAIAILSGYGGLIALYKIKGAMSG